MKKGFTLIELLAVIVILAIIALIAVPIVLNIINDSKESSGLRSAEFYLDALEYTIADAFLYHGGLDDNTYPITPEGDICKVNEATCQEENILKVEVSGDKPTGGYIELNGGVISNVELIMDEKRIVQNSNGEIIYFPCKLISGDKDTPGSKYECEVAPGTKYNFYVLSSESDGTTNLIMDRNICNDGTLATEDNTCTVDWYEDDNINSYGPVTAMDYLYNATGGWANIPNIKINYTDEGNNGSYGYGTIITSNNITKITKKDGTAITVLSNQEGYSNLKARLPYESEVADANGSNNYLYDNLNCIDNTPLGGPYMCVDGVNHINEINGYWILSSSEIASDAARYVYHSNYINMAHIGEEHYGVRPVINLKL